MAENSEIFETKPSVAEGVSSHRGAETENSSVRPPYVPLHKVYALPAPIRVIPLPSFYPANPISLLHVAYTWLSQVLRPPPLEPSVVYDGVWSPETRSVNIRDPKDMEALWQQGFFGKGSLSRSEPNWLKAQEVKSGASKETVSEQITAGRRAERISAKWERARSEQEALEAQRRVEAGHAIPRSTSSSSYTADFVAPVGPAQLLALPNSSPKGNALDKNDSLIDRPPTLNGHARDTASWVDGTLEHPSTELDSPGVLPEADHSIPNDSSVINGTSKVAYFSERGSSGSSYIETVAGDQSMTAICHKNDTIIPPALKRRKSVRFSTEVQSTTFQRSDPPSPNHKATMHGSTVNGFPHANGNAPMPKAASEQQTAPTVFAADEQVDSKEHLQLSPEEAFFLCFGIGALRILDPATGKSMPVDDALRTFRANSYFPTIASTEGLRPDDGFMLQYVVYHHFRSLGWVPRHGVKFGVDWLLYKRGPVFDHAEFGVIVLPAYSHSWWKERGFSAPQRTWHWLHGVQRVLSHVMKSLVLVYVDIPPPPVFDEALDASGASGGITGALKTYRVREILFRRWSSNRNR